MFIGGWNQSRAEKDLSLLLNFFLPFLVWFGLVWFLGCLGLVVDVRERHSSTCVVVSIKVTLLWHGKCNGVNLSSCFGGIGFSAVNAATAEDTMQTLPGISTAALLKQRMITVAKVVYFSM